MRAGEVIRLNLITNPLYHEKIATIVKATFLHDLGTPVYSVLLHMKDDTVAQMKLGIDQITFLSPEDYPELYI